MTVSTSDNLSRIKWYGICLLWFTTIVSLATVLLIFFYFQWNFLQLAAFLFASVIILIITILYHYDKFTSGVDGRWLPRSILITLLVFWSLTLLFQADIDYQQYITVRKEDLSSTLINLQVHYPANLERAAAGSPGRAMTLRLMSNAFTSSQTSPVPVYLVSFSPRDRLIWTNFAGSTISSTVKLSPILGMDEQTVYLKPLVTQELTQSIELILSIVPVDGPQAAQVQFAPIHLAVETDWQNKWRLINKRLFGDLAFPLSVTVAILGWITEQRNRRDQQEHQRVQELERRNEQQHEQDKQRFKEYPPRELFNVLVSLCKNNATSDRLQNILSVPEIQANLLKGITLVLDDKTVNSTSDLKALIDFKKNIVGIVDGDVRYVTDYIELLESSNRTINTIFTFYNTNKDKEGVKDYCASLISHDGQNIPSSSIDKQFFAILRDKRLSLLTKDHRDKLYRGFRISSPAYIQKKANNKIFSERISLYVHLYNDIIFHPDINKDLDIAFIEDNDILRAKMHTLLYKHESVQYNSKGQQVFPVSIFFPVSDTVQYSNLVVTILRGFARSWVQLLANDPTAFDDLSSEGRHEIARLLFWSAGSLEALLNEIDDIPDIIFDAEGTMIKERNRLFASLRKLISALHVVKPSNLELFGWLRILPFGFNQIWLIVDVAANTATASLARHQITKLQLLLSEMHERNVWLRLLCDAKCADHPLISSIRRSWSDADLFALLQRLHFDKVRVELGSSDKPSQFSKLLIKDAAGCFSKVLTNLEYAMNKAIDRAEREEEVEAETSLTQEMKQSLILSLTVEDIES